MAKKPKVADSAELRNPQEDGGEVETTERERRGRASGNREGTVFQRKSDGKWVGSVMLGRRPDGKPDRRTVYGKTRAEAKAKLDKLRQRAAEGMLGDAAAERLPLGAYLTRWLDTKARTVRVRTHERYRQLMEKHVVPALGHTRLAALKPDALERFYAAKLAEGLAPRTVHHIHTVLHTALEQAFRWGYVPRNVAAAVTPPKVPHQEVQWLSEEEVTQLLLAAQKDRLRGLWATAVFTGCRLGELLGLTWDAVDLDAGVLHVRKILVRVHGAEPLFGEPKTKRSRRTVPLTDDAGEALTEHRSRQDVERKAVGKDYAPCGLVFATQIGTPISGTVLRDSYKRALARAKLPSDYRFHDLRHTAATLMLANGVDIPTVAAILGHSRNSTTLDIYAHAVPSNLGRAVSAIQNALRGVRLPCRDEGA